MALTLIGQLASNQKCTPVEYCGFDLFLNRKLSARKEFQFTMTHLSQQLSQTEQCYKDVNIVLEFVYS